MLMHRQGPVNHWLVSINWRAELRKEPGEASRDGKSPGRLRGSARRNLNAIAPAISIVNLRKPCRLFGRCTICTAFLL